MTVTEQQQQTKDSNKTLEIRIFTLNIWGIPNLSKDRQERVKAIAHQLASAHEPYHYVFLQEVWSKSDYRFIADKLTKILPYSHYFYSGVIGSGTCILSCSPIHEVHYHPFTLNGYAHKILHGDWFGGKGLAMCKTTFQGIPILLINTHFHAEYDHENDEYIHHRVAQAFEVSQLLRFTQPAGHHALSLFAGDLNCSTNDVVYRLLTYNTGFVDTFIDCPLKPADGIGATNETPCNSYTPLRALKSNPTGNRIDYLFFRPSASPSCLVKTLIHDHPFPHRVPQTDFSFSDHEGVRAVLSVRLKGGGGGQEHEQQTLPIFNSSPAPPDERTSSSSPSSPPPPNERKDICFNRTDSLLDASAVCTQGLRTVAKTQKVFWWLALGLSLVQATLLGLLFLDMHPAAKFFVCLVLMALVLALGFCVYAAAVLSNQEYNAVLATKTGLERLLDEVRQNNAKYFEEQKKEATKQ